jgi:hypothetical protein
MCENKIGAILVACSMLLVGLGTSLPATAQDAATTYPKMAPIDQYLMPDRNAEIALARSAAPASISGDATVMVLGKHGYETAVQGKNGFLCFVGRGWGAAFDWDEYWSPKVKAADCMNPQAARSIWPIIALRAKMVMTGRSNAQILAALKAAYANKQLPQLEDGAMDYMMSKSSYLTDQGGHNMAHVMFYTRLKDGSDWGSGAAGAPILSSPYWSFTGKDPLLTQGLPSILVFLVAVPSWSDGTLVDMHDH